jgi:hypothetical protein
MSDLNHLIGKRQGTLSRWIDHAVALARLTLDGTSVTLRFTFFTGEPYYHVLGVAKCLLNHE